MELEIKKSKNEKMIKCLSLLSKNKEFLFFESMNQENNEKFKEEVLKISDTIQNLNSKDYQKVHTSSGTWYCSTDITNTVIMFLSSSKYPLNSSLRLLREIQSEIQRIPNYFSKQANLQENLKNSIYYLMKHYEEDQNYHLYLNVSKRKIIENKKPNNHMNFEEEKEKELMEDNDKSYIIYDSSKPAISLKRKIYIKFVCYSLITLIIILSGYLIFDLFSKNKNF